MEKNDKIYIAGHTGLVGSAILKQLQKKGFKNIITRTHKELELTDCTAVQEFFEGERPDYVFLAAAKVGGIIANNIYRAEFLYENLMIQSNVIHYSYLTGVKKLMFLGSTCIYPRDCPQPIKEEYLLTGPLEYTNEPYAIAKIAGIKMCENYNLQYDTNFISVMPTNLYGPNDNFNLETSHVLPALLRKMFLAKALMEDNLEPIKNNLDKWPIEGISGKSSGKDIFTILDKYGIKKSDSSNIVSVEIWGSGKPRREFLWSEDMADACVYIMEKLDFHEIIEISSSSNSEIRNTHINIGTGEEISIKELAILIKEIIGFKGELYFNTNKVDGTFRKVTDNSKIQKLGWKPQMDLKGGIKKMYGELDLTYSLKEY